MSVGLIRKAIDLRYTGFYLPLLTAVYLHNESVAPFEIGGHSFPPLDGFLFYISLLVLFLGAIVNHGIYRSIFGIGGPRQNPKDKWTIRYQRLALLFWKHPEIRPSSLSEVADRLDKGLDRATSSYLTTARVVGRSLSFAVIRFAYGILAIALFVLLALTVISGPIDYVGFGLLLAQAMFLVAPKVWKRFPTVVPGDAAEWVFVPEHRRAPTLLDDENVEFQRDPRGILEELVELSDEVETSPDEDDLEDSDYLVPLNGENPEEEAKAETD